MTARNLRLIGIFVLLGVLVSVAYGLLSSHHAGDRLGLFRDVVTGAVISGILSSLEIVGFQRGRATALRRLPFLAFFVVRVAIYVAVILFGLTLGSLISAFGGMPLFTVSNKDFLFAVAVSVVMNAGFAVNLLLGQGVLWSFVAGRYRRPRVEERVLLFIDMEGSTHVAERLGEVRYLDFLNRFYADSVNAILLERGEIHKYVGDEVIATWPLAAGIKEARAIRACFGALEQLRDHAAAYERDFGLRANLRAALHCGPVVRGELGTMKMEIALLGDTVNTTARIQQACRELGQRVLASGDLIDRVPALPPGIVSRALGPVALRGKEHAIELYALTPAETSLTSTPRAASG